MELKVNTYYLLKQDNTGTILETKVEQESNFCYLLHFFYRNNPTHPHHWEWFEKKYIVRKYTIIEELAPGPYLLAERSAKLQRILHA